MTGPWRLLLSGPVPPVRAMALDEALLTGGGPPTLRLYRWEPNGVSLGYFQRFDDLFGGGAGGTPVVRRITGGGAIHHADEVTFSITAPAGHPLFAGSIRDGYDRVHAILASALRRCGAPAAPRGTDRLLSDAASSPWCFYDSTEFDLAAGGRKLVGSAQRRSEGRILHHGSIVLRPAARTPATASLGALGADARPERVERALADAFAESLGAALEPSSPTWAEEERCERLAASRYGSEAWTRRR